MLHAPGVEAFQRSLRDSGLASGGLTAFAAAATLAIAETHARCLPIGNVAFSCWEPKWPREPKYMKQKRDVQQGTLALMVLRTLDVLGAQHGYGIARRIEQISGDLLFVNQGTLYPVQLRLEQEGQLIRNGGRQTAIAGRVSIDSLGRDTICWRPKNAIGSRQLRSSPAASK